MIDKFNIRVYGIWLKDKKILLSHESIDSFNMIKFPGGGVDFGEGLLECLAREFAEELHVLVENTRHLYTTENFIQSSLRENEQVIAIYYLVNSKDTITNYSTVQSTNFGSKNFIDFKWEKLDANLIDSLTFETDRKALQILLQELM